MKEYTYKFEDQHYKFSRDKYSTIIMNLQVKLEKSDVNDVFQTIFENIEKDGMPNSNVKENTPRGWYVGKSQPKNEDAINKIVKAINKICERETVRAEDMLDPIYSYVEGDKTDIVVSNSRRVDFAEKVDWTDTHSVIRSIYLMMCRYIDEFKRTIAFERCFEKYTPDCPSIEDIEETIYGCMLDVPEEIATPLFSFCRTYLKDMNYFDEGYDKIWYRCDSDFSSDIVSMDTFLKNREMQSYREMAENFPGGPEAYYEWSYNQAMRAKLEMELEIAKEQGKSIKEVICEHSPFNEDYYEDYDYDYLVVDHIERSDKIEYVNYIAESAYAALRDILNEI